MWSVGQKTPEKKAEVSFEVKIKINEMGNRTTVEKMNKSKIYF